MIKDLLFGYGLIDLLLKLIEKQKTKRDYMANFIHGNIFKISPLYVKI